MPDHFDGWVESPRPGQNLVIKINNDRTIGNNQESKILRMTNEIFSSDEPNRPVRLYGSGTTFGSKQKDYMLIEDLTGNHVALRVYLPQGTELDLQEAIEIAAATASIVNRIHSQGLCHNDLEAIGGKEHVWWSPRDHSVRIIDWHLGSTHTHYPRRHAELTFYIGIYCNFSKKLYI